MYKNIKLKKGLYHITGKSFTQALTELDPDENYRDTDLAGLDAYERQLKRFDIKVRGENCDRVEKFFLSTESAVLFPEFVRRCIKEGINKATILYEVIATTTVENRIASSDRFTYQGLTITKSKFKSDIWSSATHPSKFAKKISCPYELIRKYRLEIFAVILRDIGAQILRAVNKQAISVLKAGVLPFTLIGDTLTYADLAKFWASMDSYDMTTMLCSPVDMATILAFDEMKYCVSDYMNGMIKTPYGVTIVKCADLQNGNIIGVDKNCALEMIRGTDIILDFDKLISMQFNEIACSITVGFSKIASEAVKGLSLI